MPRDLDIIKKPRPIPTKTAPVNQDKKRPFGVVGLIMVVIGLGVLIYGFLAVTTDSTFAPATTRYASSPTVVTTPDLKAILPSTATTTPVVTATATTPVVAATPTTTSSISVQVYDAGAGEAKCLALVEKIKTAGYNGQYLGASQLERDISSVSYRQGLSSDATTLAKLITGTAPQVTESQITGVFDIIIWLGKN